ncbi:hypothetical protein [Pseudomonas sp. B392_1p]|uniref:hypothetical protein n=1 Tax=Pseudomonas sp. B392_1p TaxID=3457507 RepID=UPI003FD193DB
MKFEREKGRVINAPSEAQLLLELSKLRSTGPSGFAVLEAENSYIQVAGGPGLFMLEKREHGDGRHYRAYQGKPISPFPDGTMFSFTGGELALNQDEWFQRKQVEEVFLCFLKKTQSPVFLQWREISL